MNVDERLHEYGERWRTAQPPPPEIDLDRLVGGGSRRSRLAGGRGWLPVAAAAAAVALIVGGVGAAVTLLPRGRGSAPAAGGAVVPWQPLPTDGHYPAPYATVINSQSVKGLVPPPPPASWSALRTTLQLPASAPVAGPVDYAVTLSNPTGQPIRLDPCPAYAESVFGGGSSAASPGQSVGGGVGTQYGLDCAAVSGRVPAHGRVTFAMRSATSDAYITLAPGQVRLTWGLGHTIVSGTLLLTRPAPPGMRLVAFHDVEIAVPQEWATNAVRCGRTPERDTVIFGDGVAATCMTLRRPAVSSAELDPLFTPSPPPSKPVVVDGVAAQRGERRLPTGNTEITLVLPASAVVLTVTSPDAALAKRIVDSAHIVAVDAAGCPTRSAQLDPPAGISTQPGATQVLVPGTPANAVLCRYGDGWLGRSAAVSGDALAGLVRTLDAVPAGVTGPRSPLGEAASACAEDEARGIVATFTYPSGPDLSVYARIARCRAPIGAGNGVYHVQLTWPLVRALLDLVGDDEGFVDPNQLHPLTTSPSGG